MIKNEGIYPIVLKNSKTGEDIILQPGEIIFYRNKFIKEGYTYIEVEEKTITNDGLYNISETSTRESNYVTYLKS